MQQRFFPTNSLLNHTTLVSLSLATATQKLYGIHQPTIDKPDQNDNLSRALDCACAAWRYISALFCFILALIEPSILLRSGMMISSKTLLSDHQATTTRKLYGNDRLPINKAGPTRQFSSCPGLGLRYQVFNISIISYRLSLSYVHNFFQE